MGLKNIIIATVHSWNIQHAREFKAKGFKVKVINNPKQLTMTLLKKLNPRYVFFPHWSWKIPADIFQTFPCVIFHMTDLPYGRGGSPLQNLIVQDISKTKITALQAISEMDAGPVYLKRQLSLKGSAQEIYERAAGIIFQDMIPYILKHSPKPRLQQGHPVYFQRRNPQDGNIGLLKDLKKIFNFIRMLDAPGYPKAFVELSGIRLEFSQAKAYKGLIKATVEIKSK